MLSWAYFVISSFGKVGIWFVQSIVELPIHLAVHPVNAFSEVALRNDRGSFLESYNAFLRRQRMSVVVMILLVSTIALQLIGFGYGLFRSTRPVSVLAYSTTVTINPSWDTEADDDVGYVDDGGGGCVLDSETFTCPSDTALTLGYGRTGNIPTDCSIGSGSVAYSRSAMKYSLAAIPSNATVTKVELLANVTRTISQTVTILEVSTDTPDALSCTVPTTLFETLASGTSYATQTWNTLGSKTVDLGATAVSDVQSRLSGSQLIALGLKATENSNSHGAINSVDNGSNQPQLRVTYTLPPQTPTGFTHSADTTTTISWAWTDNATAETRYDVHDAAHSPVAGCTALAANSQSCTETGLSVNTQYTRHPNVTDANGNTDGGSASAYTSIESPNAATFSGVGTTSITVASSQSLTNLSSGSSGIWFQESVTSSNSGWLTTNSWTKSSLTANTQYSFQAKARNGDSDETSLSSASTKYTLSLAPDISSTRSTSTWYTTSAFPFTNAAGWGGGGVQYYRYVWDQTSTHAFTGSESTWSNLNANCPGGTCTTANTTLTNTATADANTWYLHVQAFNGEDVANGSGTNYGPYYFDGTSPAAPATVNDGTGADALYSTSLTTLSANWTAVTDATSGLQKYQYAIGTTSGGVEVLGYTDNGTSTAVTNSSLTLANGTTYFVSVQAIDNAGNVGSPTTSNGLKVDTAAPGAPATVNDGLGSDATYSTSTTTLSANWTTVTDGESGLQKYQYAIGTTAGGTQVSGYTDNGTSTSVTRSGLTLSEGVTYYFSVRAVDNAGNTGGAASSNGITVNTSLPTITDNQSGDATPRRTAGTIYDVDFAKSASGPNLDYAQYAVYSGPSLTGTQLKTWTDIFTVDTASYTTDWSIDFSSLQEGVNYVSVRVVALDALSNELDDVFMVTKDTIGPVITAVGASASDTTATVSWTTNEPADGQVSYGLTGAYGTATAIESALATSHSIPLSGLTTGTTYHLSVSSVDAAGNSASSADSTFTTTSPAVPTVTVPTPSGSAIVAAPILNTPRVTDGRYPTLTLSGRGHGGQTIIFTIDRTVFKRIRLFGLASTSKGFSATLAVGHLTGTRHTVYVTAVDPGGATSAAITFPFRLGAPGAFRTLRLTTAITYVVQPGDSLWKITQQFHGAGLTYGDLIRANARRHPSLVTQPELIYVGWVLTIPPG